MPIRCDNGALFVPDAFHVKKNVVLEIFPTSAQPQGSPEDRPRAPKDRHVASQASLAEDKRRYNDLLGVVNS